MTYEGTNLDDVAKETAAYQSMTTKQIKDVFVKYYAPENAIVVVVKPKNTNASDEEDEPEN